MRNLHEVQMSRGEDPLKTRLTNTNGDNDVSNIMSNMLDEYQVHKEVDDLSHEDTKGNSSIVDGHALRYVKT